MHCFDQLESAMRVNFVTMFEHDARKMAAADYEPRICAVREEEAVFATARSHTGYKVALMCKINDIRKHSDRKQLHQMLIPKWERASCSGGTGSGAGDDVSAAAGRAGDGGDDSGGDSDEELPWADDCVNEEEDAAAAPSPAAAAPPAGKTAATNNNDKNSTTNAANVSIKQEAPHIKSERVDDGYEAQPQQVPAAGVTKQKVIAPPAVPRIKYFFEKDADELQRDIEAQEQQRLSDAQASSTSGCAQRRSPAPVEALKPAEKDPAAEGAGGCVKATAEGSGEAAAEGAGSGGVEAAAEGTGGGVEAAARDDIERASDAVLDELRAGGLDDDGDAQRLKREIEALKKKLEQNKAAARRKRSHSSLVRWPRVLCFTATLREYLFNYISVFF